MAKRKSRSARPITDRDEIRRWAESQGGHPARVAKTGSGTQRNGDTGIIRIDFPGFSGGKSLEQISWDEWFDAFEENNLALVIGNNPKKPRFNKLVSRETDQRQQTRTSRTRQTRSRKTSQTKQSRSARTRSRSQGSTKNRRSSGSSGARSKRKTRSTPRRKRGSSTRS